MSQTDKPVSDWGNTFYDGLSGVGLFKADLTMVIGLILGVFFTVVGIYMIINDDSDKYLRVKGVVIRPNCVKSSTTYNEKGQPTDNYKCNIVVAYKIDGKVYSNKMYLTGSNNYIKDEPIDLMVLKTDYTNAQLPIMDGASVGCVMVTVALIVVGLTYINYYLTHKYKVFAASQGASSVVSLFR